MIVIEHLRPKSLCWSLICRVSYLITILEDKIGVSRISLPFQKIIGAIFFVGISFIGLASAYTMSKIGKGTPLPLDSATNLVVSGTYKYVRNPMAVSGIGQGLAVALFLGSPSLCLWLMVALVWQFIFRLLRIRLRNASARIMKTIPPRACGSESPALPNRTTALHQLNRTPSANRTLFTRFCFQNRDKEPMR